MSPSLSYFKLPGPNFFTAIISQMLYSRHAAIILGSVYVEYTNQFYLLGPLGDSL